MSIQRGKHGSEAAESAAAIARAGHIGHKKQEYRQRKDKAFRRRGERSNILDLAHATLENGLDLNTLLVDNLQASHVGRREFTPTRMAFFVAEALNSNLDMHTSRCHGLDQALNLVRVLSEGGRAPLLRVVGGLRQENNITPYTQNQGAIEQLRRDILSSSFFHGIEVPENAVRIDPVFLGAFRQTPEYKGHRPSLFVPVRPVDMDYITRDYIKFMISSPNSDGQFNIAQDAQRLASVWLAMNMHRNEEKIDVGTCTGAHGETHSVANAGMTVQETRAASRQRNAETGIVMASAHGLAAYFPKAQFDSVASVRSALEEASERLGIATPVIASQLSRFAIAA